MRIPKSKFIQFLIIFSLFVVSILIVLPKTPLNINTSYFNLNTSIGGYQIRLFGGKVDLDLSDFKKGLDIQGGVKIDLKADMSGVPEAERDQALSAARTVIERRVNFLGVSEPSIVPIKSGGEYRIVVEIPGIDDVTAATELIGQTAQLSFMQLKSEVVWPVENPEEILEVELWEPTGVTGSDLKGANVVLTQTATAELPPNTPQIQLLFTNEGRDKFSEVVKVNVNKPLWIFLDDTPLPIFPPTVSPDLANGLVTDPVITGNFTIEDAQQLSIQLRAGALPVPIEIIGHEQVGAQLGNETVTASFKAGVGGLIMILILMVVLYGRLGFVADFALVLYVLLVLALFKLIPVVITIPGIAGFLLSIGIAVDSNVLIFERAREELQAGKPNSVAIKLGFEKAWSSIKDANVTSLITAAILFYMGTGSVRGFAFTLFWGVAISLFTSVYIVKILVELLGITKDEGKRGFKLKLFNIGQIKSKLKKGEK